MPTGMGGKLIGGILALALLPANAWGRRLFVGAHAYWLSRVKPRSPADAQGPGHGRRPLPRLRRG